MRAHNVVDQLFFFGFQYVPEIFAIKVESCQKSRQVVDVVALPITA